MIRLVGAEVFKLRTTRAFYGLAGGALGFTTLIVLLGSLLEDEDPVLSDLIQIAFFAQLIALVIGILAVTNEFRHGTITPTLLVSPNRVRLVLAKLVAGFAVGLAIGLAATLIITAVIAATGGDTDDAAALIAGGTLVAALYAALGVGLGALIRNQVGAIIGALVYMLMLESLVGLIPGIRDVLPKYGVGGTSQALRGSDAETGADYLAQLPGGLLLVAYIAALLIAGIVVMRRRDVTS